MIVDSHTHIWDSTAQLGRGHSAVSVGIQADASSHREAVGLVDRAFVLAFKSRYLGAEIPNRFVADYVRQNAGKMIGFAGIDPTDSGWRSELRFAHEELQMRGVTISPAMQNFHPSDTRAMELYAACVDRRIPVLFEQSFHTPAAKMEFGRPILLDEVAREFPELRILIAHMGYPWIDETVTLLAKHPHVYANVAGLMRRSWLAYNALLTAHECGVTHRLLFGSDFPYRSPAASIESLYSINQFGQGTNLVAIPREHLRGIVERDALKLLGIERPSDQTRTKSKILDDEE